MTGPGLRLNFEALPLGHRKPAPEQEPPTLPECVRYLASYDQDHARVENGVGFNKLDGRLGHRLAAKPDQDWRDYDYWNAWHLTRKYVNTQLVPNGLRADLIPCPPKPERPEPVREVDLTEQGWFLIRMAHLPSDEFSRCKAAQWELPGRHYEHGQGMLLPPNSVSVEALRPFASAYGFELLEGVEARMWELTGLQDRLLAMSRAVRPSPGFQAPDPRAWAAQNAGLEYIELTMRERLLALGQSGHGVLIGDQMGTGKSGMALLAAMRAGAFDDSQGARRGVLGGRKGVLVLCPANPKYNWRLEAHHWLGRCKDRFCKKEHLEQPHLPDLKVRVLEGTGFQKVAGDVVVCNYDLLRWERNERGVRLDGEPNNLLFLLTMRDWAAVIIDEIHYLKSPEAMRTLAVQQLVREVKPPFLVGMSGTPTLNRAEEIYSELEVLGLLEHFGNRSAIGKQFKVGQAQDDDPRSSLKEMNERMRLTGYLARPKRACVLDPRGRMLPLDRVPASDLPPEWGKRAYRAQARRHLEARGYEWLEGAMDDQLKDRRELPELVELTAEGRAEYERCLRDFKSWLRDELGSSGLSGIDLDGKLNRALAAEFLVQMGKLREVVGRAKLPAVIRWIDNFLQQEEKLVVFTCFNRPRLRLLEALDHYSPETIMGGQPGQERQRRVERFQSDADCKLMIGQLLAGGEGINLVAAHDVLIMEPYWNAGKPGQATDRIDRGGQTEDVTIRHLYAADTVDQELAEMCQAKALITTAVNQGGEAPAGHLLADMMAVILAA